MTFKEHYVYENVMEAVIRGDQKQLDEFSLSALRSVGQLAAAGMRAAWAAIPTSVKLNVARGWTWTTSSKWRTFGVTLLGFNIAPDFVVTSIQSAAIILVSFFGMDVEFWLTVLEYMWKGAVTVGSLIAAFMVKKKGNEFLDWWYSERAKKDYAKIGKAKKITRGDAKKIAAIAKKYKVQGSLKVA